MKQRDGAEEEGQEVKQGSGPLERCLFKHSLTVSSPPRGL